MDVRELGLFYDVHKGGFPKAADDSMYANAIDPSVQPKNYTLNDLISGQGSSSSGGGGTSNAADPYADLQTYLDTPAMKPLPTQPLDTSYENIMKGRSAGTPSFLSSLMDGIGKGLGLLNQQYGDPNQRTTTGGATTSSPQFGTGLGQVATGSLPQGNTTPAKTDHTALYIGLGAGAFLLILGVVIYAVSKSGNSNEPRQ